MATMGQRCCLMPPVPRQVAPIQNPLLRSRTYMLRSRPTSQKNVECRRLEPAGVPRNNPPSGSGVISVVQNGYTEYHICGTLTLSGTGSFAPNTDAIIVIENGSLVLSNNANVSLARSSIVLTGNNTAASNIQFPNGNGHAAALSMSPPTASNDPWQGVAMYQDPSLTNSVDDSWGPGATLNMDGLVSAEREYNHPW